MEQQNNAMLLNNGCVATFGGAKKSTVGLARRPLPVSPVVIISLAALYGDDDRSQVCNAVKTAKIDRTSARPPTFLHCS